MKLTPGVEQYIFHWGEPDPTLTMLRECVPESEADDGTPDEIKARIQYVMHFLDTPNTCTWYAQVRGMPRSVAASPTG